MTSKIKVDNIENQCGGAVVTKCGGTTTITGSVVKANNIQASDGGNLVSQSGTTITLGASGDTINLASGASQTGFGRTGTVDWITTPKTATFTAVSGEGYFCNTSGGAFTVNLPAGVAGAIVSLADYAATWQTNNVTVTPNGTDKIGSFNENAGLNVEGQSVTFVFVDSTQGWINTMDSTSNVRAASPYIAATGGTITESGNCKIHTFTGPGTFTVCTAAVCSANNQVSYMVIAGGGGGVNDVGGAGGAGGFREDKSPVTPYTASPLDGAGDITVTATSFPITVGSGGAATSGSRANQGSTSTFSTISSAGGGGGGTLQSVSGPNRPGGSGGSGGGAGGDNVNGGTIGSSTGNSPPVSPAQGSAGGGSLQGSDGSSNTTGGGGGGGAAGVGAAGAYMCTPNPMGGNGGTATSTQIIGSTVFYAGGGGGGGFPAPASGAGLGGGVVPAPTKGGGGDGGAGNATAGTANTGGGGGGAHGGSGANGGSGIVVIRYKFQ